MKAQIRRTQMGMDMTRLQRNPLEKEELLLSSITFSPILYDQILLIIYHRNQTVIYVPLGLPTT
jgi:hypothetical protein